MSRNIQQKIKNARQVADLLDGREEMQQQHSQQLRDS